MFQVSYVVVVGYARLLAHWLTKCIATDELRRGRHMRIAYKFKSVLSASHNALHMVVLWEVAADTRLVKRHLFGEALHQRAFIIMDKPAIRHVHPVHKYTVVSGLVS